jgi:TolB protein
MVKRALVICGVLASLAPVAASQSAPPPAALLTYSATQAQGICIAQPNGTRRLRVTGRFDDRGAAWSRDGKFVAFVRTTAGQSRIVIADARNRIIRRFEPATAVADPTWAPDGRRLAYSAGAPVPRIVIASRQGQVLSTLPTGRNAATTPAWSPNGREIAYTDKLDLDQQRAISRIYAMNVDGTGKRLIASPAREPAWAPDGSRVAYVALESATSETGHVAVATASGATPRRITSSAEPESGPSWSPRGRLITFARGIGAASVIYSIRPDGVGERLLVRSSRYGAADPAWRPPVALPRARRAAC